LTPTLNRPEALAGRVVAAAAPSSCFDRELFLRGVKRLEQAGAPVRVPEEVYARRGFLAGSDEQRASALVRAWEDPDAGAVWCARGGYGSLRILPLLDFERMASAPRLMAGFSDVTALFSVLCGRLRVPAIHAPVATALGKMEQAHAAEAAGALVRLLSGEPPLPLRADPPLTLRPGKAEGRLLGGNLATLCSLCGTPFFPDLAGCVLFLEDHREAPYRIDRMLAQLRLSGLLSGVTGVALGGFSDCGPPDQVEQVLADALSPLEVPVAGGFPAGHGKRNLPFALGVPVSLDADAGVITFLESPTA